MQESESNIIGYISESPLKSDFELQLKVFKQIQKDIKMIGEEYEIDESKGLQFWWDQLIDLLNHLLQYGDIRNLLYRIDVSEAKIRQIGQLTIYDVGIFVIQRELEKVLLREKYS